MSVPKGYHKTKDGRIAKKGLYYYMNKAKKSGKSRPGKGTVTDKALKESAVDCKINYFRSAGFLENFSNIYGANRITVIL